MEPFYFPTRIQSYTCRQYYGVYVPLHVHFDTEIAYCSKGILQYNIPEIGIVELRPGQALIVESGCPHNRLSNPDSRIEGLYLKFNSNLLGDDYIDFTNRHFQNPVLDTNDPAVPEEIRTAFRRLAEASQIDVAKRNTETDLLIRCELYRLILFFYRDFPSEPVTREDNTKVRWGLNQRISSILHYISKHPEENLSLERIAEKFGYEKTYLSKCFSSYIGIGIHQYTNQCRIQKACRLLVTSKSSIQEISNRCGFKQEKTMCRVFKELTGFSPSEYRKKCIDKNTDDTDDESLYAVKMNKTEKDAGSR